MAERTVAEIAEHVKGELTGDGSVIISGISDLKNAGEGDIAFVLDPKFANHIQETKASCVVAPFALKAEGQNIIAVKNPAQAFSQIVRFTGIGEIPHPEGIHQTAVIGEGTEIADDVSIGAYCVIEKGAKIGPKTVIYPHTYVGQNTVIGGNCIVYSNVSIRENITIGDNVIIHSQATIGSDGFGYDSSSGRHVKIPHVGTVVIEDDVEIGASVAIDRAKFSSTRIGRGTKIDNLTQIAHNVTIGENCIIVSQVGIAGSSTLGKNVILAGQVGVSDHVEIGDNVIVGAQSGVNKSLASNAVYLGSPAKRAEKQAKIFAVLNKLPEIYKSFRKFEKKIKG